MADRRVNLGSTHRSPEPVTMLKDTDVPWMGFPVLGFRLVSTLVDETEYGSSWRSFYPVATELRGWGKAKKGDHNTRSGHSGFRLAYDKESE